MDLEQFEDLGIYPIHEPGTTAEVLDNWYKQASRNARWMDLIGDYGGKEYFVIEGDSLLSIVLDDPQLAIGKDDPSFQILHAYFILEKLLNEYKSRDANFGIVFFLENRHISIRTCASSFKNSSRSLARKMMFRHLLKPELDLDIQVFKNFDDPDWRKYSSQRRPMFMMVYGGGKGTSGLAAAQSVLVKRFLFAISNHGLAFALLNGAEYRDSTISTFVFESRGQGASLISFSDQSLLVTMERLDRCLDLSTPLQVIEDDFDSLKDVIALSTTQLPEVIFLFILHCVLLPSIPIQSRSRRFPDRCNSLNEQALITLTEVFRALTSAAGHSPDVDGHIFMETVLFLIDHSGSLELFPGEPVEQVLGLWSRNGGPCLEFGQFARHYQTTFPSSIPSSSTRTPYKLLPFRNEVFDAALHLVHVPQTDDEEPTLSIFSDGVVLQDTQHWHNRKRSILPSYLGGGTTQPLEAKERRKWLKREQRAQASLQKQAASLTGASGKMLNKVVIPPVGTKKNVHEAKQPSNARNPHPKKMKQSGADKLRAKIQDEKAKTLEQEAGDWLARKIKSFKDDTIDQQLLALSDMRRSTNTNAVFPPVALQIRVYEIHLRLKQWVNSGLPATKNRMIVAVVRILKEIKGFGATISKDCSAFLEDVFRALSLESSCSKVYVPSADERRSNLPFKPIKLFSKSSGKASYPDMKIDVPPSEWQLQHFGDYMDRSLDSASDPRVSFDPDRWQRDVLDAIDAHKSVLALAPTSAGKTFISFYAMEKVLRESDTGVIVYVAPTKALVNQIAAEVYGRFSKNYKGNETLLAILTRDVRSGDIQRAQILVTVPEMFAILLLSPTLAVNWTSRIERIILDEIHSIGQDQGGAVWEQIILMAPCPVIGLSATVGSPEKFNYWLASVQTNHKFHHVCVHHPHRYSHLRKFLYHPSRSNVAFRGLKNHEDTHSLAFAHPISFLDKRSSTMPSDMALEASDCLMLCKALQTLSLLPPSLEPSVFFSEVTGLIGQKEVLGYEEALKAVLNDVIRRDREEGTDNTAAILSLLGQPQIADDMVMDRQQFKDNLLRLVCDLHVQNNLPAIFFSFDRSDCEFLARYLTERLAQAEAEWQSNSPEWKAKLQHIRKWKEQEKIRIRQREREVKQAKDQNHMRESEPSASWEASFDPDEPLSDFSFAGRYPDGKEDMDKLCLELRRWTSTPEWAISALRRGIAVHHAGMPKRYRTAIESLFRQRFIRVMLATGTLALGINAPTKTAVFCGDSPYLTALMYRQCGGRAGRRGYDLRGNVVFYGLPYSRVQRLVLSRLPDLGDSFPMTTTLILRFFNLLDGSQQSDFAKRCIQNILDLPRISHRSELGRDQVLHHVRFSIEYLRSSGLLNVSGQPTNLFGIASHLYYTEPSNFALVHLFESGIIHGICSNPSKIQAEAELLLLFAHLFGRTYVPSYISQKSHITDIRQKYPSHVILPNLPLDVGQQLQEHDLKILDIFSGYARSYAKEYMEKIADNVLPLSGTYPSDSEPSEGNLFLAHLDATSLKVIARSLFAANSGLDDDFTSVKDLVHTVRKGIHLHEHAIPSMSYLVAYSDHATSSNRPEHVLNAYLVDFYNHGQLHTLTSANGIRKGDIWYKLQDFDLVLRTVRASLQELLLQLSESRSRSVDDFKDLLEDDSETGDDNPIEDEDQERSTEFKRPPHTEDADWSVYQMVELISNTFTEKFYNIGA